MFVIGGSADLAFAAHFAAVAGTAAQGNRTVETASTAGAVASDVVTVNEFLSYNPGTKTATLRLVAGYTQTNSSLNLNGGAKGNQTLIMPVGWTVKSRFITQDGHLPHSAIVIDSNSPIPAMPPEPAFARAYSLKLEEGLTQGREEVMTFKATRPGDYWIFCGVPGHGVSGMYINLDVSDSAKVPAYRT